MKIRLTDFEQLIVDYHRDNRRILQNAIKWLTPKGDKMAKMINKVNKDGIYDEDDGALPAKKSVKMKVDADKQPAAMKIMREVAKAAQKPTANKAKPKQDKKVSAPGSKKQSMDFAKTSKKSTPQAVESETEE